MHDECLRYIQGYFVTYWTYMLISNEYSNCVYYANSPLKCSRLGNIKNEKSHNFFPFYHMA